MKISGGFSSSVRVTARAPSFCTSLSAAVSVTVWAVSKAARTATPGGVPLSAPAGSVTARRMPIGTGVGRLSEIRISMSSPSLTSADARAMLAAGGGSSSTKVRSMLSPTCLPAWIALSAPVLGGAYDAVPPGSGALISRLPLDWPAGMVMVSVPPAPWIRPFPKRRPPRSNCTVWSVENRTPLMIDTVDVAESPPSVSSVTAFPFASVRVKRQSGVGVRWVTVSSAP